MAAFTTAFVAASAGILTMARGSTTSFTVTWGSNISQFRFNRIWAGVVGASDEDTQQSVTIVSEGSRGKQVESRQHPDVHELARNGQSGAPIQARIQVLASQVDTF